MKYSICMAEQGERLETELNADQFDNLKRLMNSDKTALFQLPSLNANGGHVYIAPRHVVLIEEVRGDK